MADLPITVVGPMSQSEEAFVLLAASADVDLSNPDYACTVPCAVVSPMVGETQDKVFGFAALLKTSDLVKMCLYGLESFMRSQFMQPVLYDKSQGYTCQAATDMVAVAQYLGQSGADVAEAWPIGKREFVLLLVSSPEFQAACAHALQGQIESRGVTVLIPGSDDAGHFVPAPVPATCLEQHEHYDDPPLAPPSAIVPVEYAEGAGTTEGSASSSESTSWLPWTLVGLAAFGVGVVVYDQVKTGKERRP